MWSLQPSIAVEDEPTAPGNAPAAEKRENREGRSGFQCQVPKLAAQTLVDQPGNCRLGAADN